MRERIRILAFYNILLNNNDARPSNEHTKYGKIYTGLWSVGILAGDSV
jgi:hypothetical protein